MHSQEIEKEIKELFALSDSIYERISRLKQQKRNYDLISTIGGSCLQLLIIGVGSSFFEVTTNRFLFFLVLVLLAIILTNGLDTEFKRVSSKMEKELEKEEIAKEKILTMLKESIKVNFQSFSESQKAIYEINLSRLGVRDFLVNLSRL